MGKIETVYLVHHSHTDVGYTHDQPIVWDLYERFIDTAINLAGRYESQAGDEVFRWTVETTAPLVRWLENSSAKRVDRFLSLEKAGRIEVTGMFANMTPLADTDQLIESLANVATLRDRFGITVRYAMNCDVNGQNWPLADLLLDAGIEGLTMAINPHFGGPLTPRPLPFLWEAPSGRSLPTYNGWTYDKGWAIGIGRDSPELLREMWPKVQRYLDDIGYPLPILMLQSFHPFGDNGPAFDFSPFIAEWNGAADSPRIVTATPSIWWSAVAGYHHLLPTLRGDWTDYWNFGAVSSARETALNRRTRVRLRAADGFHGALRVLDPPRQTDGDSDGDGDEPRWAHSRYDRHRTPAWDALNLWDEHTWGADSSVRLPDGDDTLAQWYHKAQYAYRAHSLSLLLQRDALAQLATLIQRGEDDEIVVYNSLPWSRTIAGVLPPTVISVRGIASDTTAGRHHLDRRHTAARHIEDIERLLPPNQRWVLPPTEVPGYGYTVVRRSALVSEGDGTQPNRPRRLVRRSEESQIETTRYVLVFDRERGGVASIYDKVLSWEWVDRESPLRMHGFVHEEAGDHGAVWARNHIYEGGETIGGVESGMGWKPGWWARRRPSERVLTHQVLRSPLGIVVRQTLDAPGIDGVLTQRVFVPSYAEWIEFESWWTMTSTSHPEATYLAFPFALPEATVRFDVGGVPVVPDVDQLPGCCRDYFTVQGWVDFSDGERGVTVAVPDNPLVQLGGFHFGDCQRRCSPEPATLLGWVTNNYWETNFRASQPGRVSGRYRMHPHAGGVNESDAHRFGWDAANDEPVVHPLVEEPFGDSPLPQEGALLDLPAEGPVFAIHVKPDGPMQVVVRLQNTSDEKQTATIRSGLMRIDGARLCGILGDVGEAIPVKGESVTVPVAPRAIATVRLAVR